MDSLFAATFATLDAIAATGSRNASRRKYRELVDDYNELVDKYNDLVHKYRSLLQDYDNVDRFAKETAHKHNALVSRFNEQISLSEQLRQERDRAVELRDRYRSWFDDSVDLGLLSLKIVEMFAKSMPFRFEAGGDEDRLSREQKMSLNLWLWALCAIMYSLREGCPFRIQEAIKAGDMARLAREAGYLASLLGGPDKDGDFNEHFNESTQWVELAWQRAQDTLRPALEAGVFRMGAADEAALVFEGAESRKSRNTQQKRAYHIERLTAWRPDDPFWRDVLNAYFNDQDVIYYFLPWEGKRRVDFWI